MSDTHEPHHTAAAESKCGTPRRNLLGWLAAALGGLSAAAAGVPIVGYLFSPILRTPADEWIDLGPIDDFPEQQTRIVEFVDPLHLPWDGESKNLAAYVRRKGPEEFLVFSVNCTHLGCPVSWFPQSGLFLCPCHGGVYYEDGSRASGPPPRGLYTFEARVRDGRLAIRGGRLPTLQQPG